MAKRDYYEVLGVSRDAPPEEVKKAFHRAALKHHPHRNPGDKDAEARFKEAAEAYEVLSDADKRKRYDSLGHAGLEGTAGRGFSGVEDIFEAFGDIFSDSSFFGDLFGMRGRGRRGPRAGASLRCEITIDFKDVLAGARKSIEIARDEICATCAGQGCEKGKSPEKCARCDGRGQVFQTQGFFSLRSPCPSCGGAGAVNRHPCPACRGTGKTRTKKEIVVQVPPGIEDGTRMRLAGEGEPSLDGGSRGDLYCDVFVRDHPFFRREGEHLVCEIPITFTQAALGGEVELPTLDGPGMLKVPRGTQSGDILRLRDKGLPRLGEKGRGDLHVRVVIQTPKKLTTEQEELLRRFAATEQATVDKERKKFFDKIRDFFA